MNATVYHEHRLLILTPTGDDSIQASRVLSYAGFNCEVVQGLVELAEQVSIGVGAILLAEEAVFGEKLTPLLDELAHQPKWSDIPIILITSRPDSEEGGHGILGLFGETGNITFIQRPLTLLSLNTAMGSALRARKRQYQIRNLLHEQKRLYEKAEDAIKVRDEFMSIASHELKTPITSLKLRLQIAARDFKPDEGKVPSIERLERLFSIGTYQIERLNSLVDDLLDVSRIQSGKMSMNLECADLASLLRNSIERLKEHIASASCDLQASLQDGIWGNWDPNRIEQVVVNLVGNAVKYAPSSKIQVTLSQVQDRAVFCVHDNGPGIPDEQQKRLFQRFERAGASKNIGGLGLGLYIVRQIVEAHRGTVRVESSPGTGTSFIVDLPMHSATSRIQQVVSI